MARSRRSLAITDAYRARLEVLVDRATTTALRRFAALDLNDLDGSYGPISDSLAASLGQYQADAVRLGGAYLSAFLASETGRSTSALTLPSAEYAGRSRDGRPLSEALLSPLIGMKANMRQGRAKALSVGRDRLRILAEMDTAHAGRQSVLDAIQRDDRFDGWRRAIKGTCGACAAVAGSVEHGIHFSVHPGCKCVSEPSVSGVANHFPRPTGAELMAAKTPEEQDQALGPAAADAFRNGLPLADLVGHSEMENESDWITQRPLDAALN